MKETGLMFKAPLVRAILDGTKTQTRRVVKPAPATDQPLQYITTETGFVYAHSIEKIDSHNLRRIRWDSPVGKPGDHIYVRETWAPNNVIPACHRPDRDYLYAATDAETYAVCRWNPSIHMPKSASRIWLEVTGVRVERLQSISEADCIAEGIAYDPGEGGVFHLPGFGGCSSDTAAAAFQKIWESTGGDWNANPWVWVIDFKQIPLPGEQGS